MASSDEDDDKIITNNHRLRTPGIYQGAATITPTTPQPPLPLTKTAVGVAMAPDALNEVTVDRQRARREIEQERIAVMVFAKEPVEDGRKKGAAKIGAEAVKSGCKGTERRAWSWDGKGVVGR
jgi:hypothetical protein